LPGPGAMQQSLCFAPDGSLLAVTGEQLRRWDVSGEKPKELAIFKEVGPTARITIAADGKVLATSTPDLTVHVWDMASGTPRKRATLVKHPEPLNSIALSADGR